MCVGNCKTNSLKESIIHIEKIQSGSILCKIPYGIELFIKIRVKITTERVLELLLFAVLLSREQGNYEEENSGFFSPNFSIPRLIIIQTAK